jgi:hypothetical protein
VTRQSTLLSCCSRPMLCDFHSGFLWAAASSMDKCRHTLRLTQPYEDIWALGRTAHDPVRHLEELHTGRQMPAIAALQFVEVAARSARPPA